jgi:hypothetical protein
MRQMASTLYKTALFTLVLVACGDDDSEPPAGGPDGAIDAAMDANDADDASDDHDGGDGDSSVKPDGSLDQDSNVDPDAGDAGMCELVHEPLLQVFSSPLNAVRVPLDVFCGGDGCKSLAEFAENEDCTELGDAAVDDLELAEDAGSGCCFNWWIRTEGCGNVQYRSYGTYPRVFNFDAATGEVIGYGRQDDIEYDFGGCTHWGFVAGELLHDCPTATESICSR